MDLLVDVGCYDTPMILAGDAKERICIDLVKFPEEFTGTKIQEEWLKVQLPRTADLILCLEVVEHQHDKDVMEFTEKLLTSARLVIVSMPLDWPAGKCIRHLQDPIDSEKFHRLMHGKRPLKMQDILTLDNHVASKTRMALYAGVDS